MHTPAKSVKKRTFLRFIHLRNTRLPRVIPGRSENALRESIGDLLLLNVYGHTQHRLQPGRSGRLFVAGYGAIRTFGGQCFPEQVP
jgi:hypothetical protein